MPKRMPSSIGMIGVASALAIVRYTGRIVSISYLRHPYTADLRTARRQLLTERFDVVADGLVPDHLLHVLQHTDDLAVEIAVEMIPIGFHRSQRARHVPVIPAGEHLQHRAGIFHIGRK